MAKEELKKIIEKAVLILQKSKILPKFENSEFLIEMPRERNRGDYSTNIAYGIAEKIKKSPQEVALLLQKEIEKDKSIIEKIDVVNGFINFWLKREVFIDSIGKTLKASGTYGKNNALKNKKVVIDYTDPNPFKEFHIGHLMSNAIGESLSRVFEFQGAKVKRVCYSGDVGIHVAKAIWGMIRIKDSIRSLGSAALLDQKMKLLNSAYADGSQQYEVNPEAKKEIVDLNKKIYDRSDKEINYFYDLGKKWSLKHFDEIYKKLGTKFDDFIFESQTGKIGQKIVETGLKKGVFEHSEGAVVFKGEQYGLHTRVFINSEGIPTYEAKDLGLAKIKFDKFRYDVSVVVTGNEVNDYFKVMLCAMDKLLPELASKTKHIGHGMLRLPEGKMSSRTGKVISGESMISQIEELINDKIKNRELNEKEKIEISQKVAIGAIKYSVLKQSIGKDIIFDFKKSISFDGDSGPYLQYSYARAMSVLKKAKAERINASLKLPPENIGIFEKSLYYFPEIVLRAGTSCEPHHLLQYLTELAGMFNGYYAENKIVDKEDKLSAYKIALTKAFAIVMENGLWLIGISPLEKM